MAKCWLDFCGDDYKGTRPCLWLSFKEPQPTKEPPALAKALCTLAATRSHMFEEELRPPNLKKSVSAPNKSISFAEMEPLNFAAGSSLRSRDLTNRQHHSGVRTAGTLAPANLSRISRLSSIHCSPAHEENLSAIEPAEISPNDVQYARISSPFTPVLTPWVLDSSSAASSQQVSEFHTEAPFIIEHVVSHSYP